MPQSHDPTPVVEHGPRSGHPIPGYYRHFKGGLYLVHPPADWNSYFVDYEDVHTGDQHTRAVQEWHDRVRNTYGKIVPRFEMVNEPGLASSVSYHLCRVHWLERDRQRQQGVLYTIGVAVGVILLLLLLR